MSSSGNSFEELRSFLEQYLNASADERSRIDEAVRASGQNPGEVLGDVLTNVVVELVKSGKMDEASSLIERARGVVGEETYVMLTKYVKNARTIKQAEVCASRGDFTCLKQLFGGADDENVRKLIVITWLEHLVRDPGKYGGGVLEETAKLCEQVGMSSVAEAIRRYAQAPEIAGQVVKSVMEALTQPAVPDAESELEQALRSGDPRRVREYKEKYRDILGTQLSAGLTLGEFLDAAAWWFEEGAKTLGEVFTTLSKAVGQVEAYMSNPETPITFSDTEVLGAISALDTLLKNRYFNQLVKAGLLKTEEGNLGEELRKMLGTLYFALVVRAIVKGDPEEAEQYMAKARQYTDEYDNYYSYIKNFLVATPSVSDIECILRSEGILWAPATRGVGTPAPAAGGGRSVPT